jgi:hypothetical protein
MYSRYRSISAPKADGGAQRMLIDVKVVAGMDGQPGLAGGPAAGMVAEAKEDKPTPIWFTAFT